MLPSLRNRSCGDREVWIFGAPLVDPVIENRVSEGVELILFDHGRIHSASPRQPVWIE
jgi:hypothetical protein